MDNWMPPKLKAILTYTSGGDTINTDITGDVTNWNELQTSMQRDGISGVFMSVDMPIKVAFNAKSILHDLFFASFLSASASIQILQRDPFDLDTYTQIHSAKLNFSTFKEDADTAEISSETRDFNNLVKSVGKTKYDIKVSDFTLAQKWKYQHNLIAAGGVYTIAEAPQTLLVNAWQAAGPGETPLDAPFARQTLSISLDSASLPLGGRQDDIRNQELESMATANSPNLPVLPGGGEAVNLSPHYFFQFDNRYAYADSFDVHFSMKFRIVWYAAGPDFPNYTSRTLRIGLFNTERQTWTAIKTWDMPPIPNTPITNYNWIDIDYETIITGEPGDKIQLDIYTQGWGGGTISEKGEISIQNFDHFNVSYLDKSLKVENIPAVTQLGLANALLQKMGNGDPLKTYTATIDTDTDNPWTFNHYLIAAESIRGFENAAFHVNFNDFLEYMQFLGYEWDVDESTLTVMFKKRAVFFDPTVTALELTEGEVANLQISADDEYAYSTVRVGYEKPDIENTNGRFAVCGAFDYATDYKKQGEGSDSSLEIMCPYKADPVEIEILSWTRGEKTTDQKADNDIFMLAGEINAAGDLVESRQTEYAVIDTETNDSISWFNVPYIPYFITLRNAQKIGVAARNLKFTGTDAYREAGLTGLLSYDIYSDMELPARLFAPVTCELEAGTHQSLPERAQRFGLVTFPWKGLQYQGFISKLIKAHNNEAPTTWTLMVYSATVPTKRIVFYGQVTEYKDTPQPITFSGTITETV